jgi:hypothetical protein
MRTLKAGLRTAVMHLRCRSSGTARTSHSTLTVTCLSGCSVLVLKARNSSLRHTRRLWRIRGQCLAM